MKWALTVWALLVVFVGTAIGWWQRDHDWWRPPAPLLPELPALQPLDQAQQVSLAAAVERPLLWTARRPPRAPTEEDRLIEELQTSRLLAVLQSGGQRIALVRSPDGQLRQYSQASQPWQLDSFDGRQAHFVTASGQRASLPLQPQPGR